MGGRERQKGGERRGINKRPSGISKEYYKLKITLNPNVLLHILF
jgi:hypothetical protein